MIESNYESESLLILAGLDFDLTEEREEYFWKAVKELEIDIEAENSDIEYGKFIANSVLKNELTPEIGLQEMTKIYRSTKTKNKDKFFHFNEIDEEIGWIENIGYPIGVKPKIPIENLDEFLRTEFELFLKHEKLETKRQFKENEYGHNREKIYRGKSKNNWFFDNLYKRIEKIWYQFRVL